MSTSSPHSPSTDWRSRPPSQVQLCVRFRGPWLARGDVGRRLAQRLRGFQVSVAITPDSIVLRRPNRGIPPSLCQGVCNWLREQPEVVSVEPIALQVWRRP